MTTDQVEAGRTTWRYLRVSIVLVVIGLATAIVIEHGNANCLQTSISAYYFTPVRGLFVGGLMAIGVCLIALKGNTPAEDVLLNLAGGFAPLVALIPTRDPADCSSRPDEHVAPNIANNVPALLFVAALGLVLARVLVRRSGAGVLERTPAPLGWLLAAVTWAGVTGLFWVKGDDDSFSDWAHLGAAVLMFVCIFLVVAIDALDYERWGQEARRTASEALPEATGTRLRLAARNRYGVIAGAMLSSLPLAGAMKLAESRHAVLAIEAALIVLFAIYWVLQTCELWDKGLRD